MLVMLAGFGLGVLTYVLTVQCGNWFIESRYMSDESVSRRSMSAVESLQTYIRDNNLASRDTEQIARWSMTQKDTYILFYKNRHLAMEAGWWGIDDSASIRSRELSEQTALTIYPVSFRDGVFQAVVYDFSEVKLYDAMQVIGIVLACALFALLMLLYNSRITHAIIDVSREIQEIGRGNLDTQMRPVDNDELGRLTQSVDAMRRSLIRKTQEEQAALKRTASSSPPCPTTSEIRSRRCWAISIWRAAGSTARRAS